jgi:hypothetical protein
VIARSAGRSRRFGIALLLALQALGGGAVPLAHATDRTTAPVALESQHTASCPVLHDAARCAICQYASVRVLPTTSVPSTHWAAAATLVVAPRFVPPTGTAEHFDAPPRAPPTVRS